jgi:hypothetical protein
MEGLWQVASAPKCQNAPSSQRLTNLLHNLVSKAPCRPFEKISSYSDFTNRCSVDEVLF